MTETGVRPETGPRLLAVDETNLWVERRGDGPDVLLIAGLSDTVEAWEPQLAGLSDRYVSPPSTTAGRSAMIPERFTAADMADDAAAILRGLASGRRTWPASPVEA